MLMSILYIYKYSFIAYIHNKKQKNKYFFFLSFLIRKRKDILNIKLKKDLKKIYKNFNKTYKL